jgi:hypothetical protein
MVLTYSSGSICLEALVEPWISEKKDGGNPPFSIQSFATGGRGDFGSELARDKPLQDG